MDDGGRASSGANPEQGVGHEAYDGRQARGNGLAIPYAFALFVSAFLLFSIEPMVAKAITPLLGGTPAVWISCMLFFQVLLLAGYVYVHASLTWLGARKQAILQLLLVVLPLLALPIVIDGEQVRGWNRDTNPTFSLLFLLARSVGPAFVVLSMSGPLLQGWFAALPSPGGAPRNPYVLYAASNAGSVAALAAYPVIIEPHIGLKRQFELWYRGYFGFVALVAVSALTLLFLRQRAEAAPSPSRIDEAAIEEATPASGPRWRRRLIWAALAFVPSTYMMGLTTFITTDVAPIPLFWVLPLLLYLVTFILVFSGRQLFSDHVLDRIIVIGLTFSMASSILGGAWSTILVHLSTFFFVALFCHLRLVRMRPHAAELTDFFLWLSVGGAAGGFFNGVIAPTFFSRSFEYPMALLFAALCRVGGNDVDRTQTTKAKVLDWVWPIGLGLVQAVILLIATTRDLTESPFFFLAVTIPFLVNYATRLRVLRFALGVGALLAATGIYTGNVRTALHVERNFFGVIRVAEDKGRHVFSSGNIIHGIQKLDPEKRREPLAYYHRQGPLGDVFAAFGDKLRSVAVVGLGAGTTAAYARPGQDWTFYEINPAVVRVAQTPAYFTYLSDAFPDEKHLHIQVGDARLRLEEAPDGAFSLIMLDAFTSDAIPVHLLTREAVDLYRRKLEPGGLLAFHTSNQFIRLPPVMARVARDRKLLIAGKTVSPSHEQNLDGMQQSTWLVMAEDDATLQPLIQRGFIVLKADDEARVWSDDYSDILGAYRF